MKGARFLILVSVLLALASVPTAAAPQADPCGPGTAYDAACDVNHDNTINIADIQLTAGHWNQSGTWVSDNQHDHLGQTWTGTDNPLTLKGAYGSPNYAGLVLENSAEYGHGAIVRQATGSGIHVVYANTGVSVFNAGTDGFFVDEAGNPSWYYYSDAKNGFAVAGAQGNGLYVGRADEDGVQVYSAGDDGIYVDWVGSPSTSTSSTLKNGFEVAGAQGYGLYIGRADEVGVLVNSAGFDGVRVSSAGTHGVYVDSAGGDGVVVHRAGNPSGTNSPWFTINGFEVNGSEGNGLYVGRADFSGINVSSAGIDGVKVSRVGNPTADTTSDAKNGFEVAGAEGFGLYVGRADIDGVRIRSAYDDGIQIGEDGFFPNFGLYVPGPGTPSDTLMPNTADAAGEWALYTVDKIAASNMLMSAQTLVAVAGGDQPLSPGDVVAAMGLADPIPGALNRLALMTPANAERANIAGVVSSRMALTPLPGKEGEQDLRSVAGPAQPGDYVAITVLGVAQVKVQDGEAIQPGQRLTVSDTPGQARALQSKLIEGMMVTEGAPVIGVALEAPKDGLVWVLVNPQ